MEPARRIAASVVAGISERKEPAKATQAVSAVSAVSRPRICRRSRNGMRRKVQARVPARLPMVERAKRRPAVLPTTPRSRTASRTAQGETVASITLAGPNRTEAASRVPAGLAPVKPARVPASRVPKRSSTASNAAASTIIRPSEAIEGCRSASQPPHR